jgi:hypothetical protein
MNIFRMNMYRLIQECLDFFIKCLAWLSNWCQKSKLSFFKAQVGHHYELKNFLINHDIFQSLVWEGIQKEELKVLKEIFLNQKFTHPLSEVEINKIRKQVNPFWQNAKKPWCGAPRYYDI